MLENSDGKDERNFLWRICNHQRKWVIQCKRWKNFPTTTQIFNEISTALEHQPNFWVLAIPLDPSANQLDYVENIAEKYKSYKIKTKIITLREIENLLYCFPEARQILLEGSVLENE